VSFADEAADAAEDVHAAKAEARIADVRRDRDAARQALKVSRAEVDSLAARLHLVEQISDLDPRPPKWLTPGKKRSAHHATVTTILSDAHFDEVVNPDEIGGVNAYNRDIATMRLRRYFDQVCTVARDHMAGVTFDGCVAMFGGDMLSGDIHEELTVTNEATVLQSCLYWSELLAAGITQLADEFGQVYVPVVVGNHPRRSRKPRSKGRAVDNFDWFLGHLVARLLRDDARVTFAIPEAAHIHFDVYGTKYRLEHGDSARGGGGWIGAIGPVMKREQKIRTASEAMDQPFDHLVVGHWHQLSWLRGATINGSSKGLDEYAAINGFGFEPPQQAMWLTTPERGITLQAPVFVAADRKKEGW
jgi:hypothetical protein